MIIYRLPTYDDYELLRDYVVEHYSNHETSISASLGLTNMKYEDWVDKITHNSEIGDEEWGKNYLYLVLDNDRLVGLLSIRYDLPKHHRDLYGDIGYGVRPSERRKGYATKMLKHGLNVCKEKNMTDVIVGCYEDNYGSNKVIQKNGGVLCNILKKEMKISNEWTINLNSNYYRINL